MLDKHELRQLVQATLRSLEPEIPYSEEAVELLMMTAATESNLGTYWEQAKGPALGVFQMEPNTHNDIWENYLKYKKDLAEKINTLTWFEGGTEEDELHHNLVYQIIMARVLYKRVPAPMPKMNDLWLAAYYKKWYNTPLGKGTVQKAIEKYNKYCK